MNTSKPLIYVAGPITAPTQKEIQVNVDAAMLVGIQIFQMGGLPFVPHLNHYLDLLAWKGSKPIDYEAYMELDFKILDHADALYFMGESPGAKREKEFAVHQKIPVFEILEHLDAWIAERREFQKRWA